MSQAQLAAGPDRLPWLNDEIPRSRRDRSGARNLGAAVALVAIAGLSFWLGKQNWDEQGSVPPSTTVALPPPSVAQPEVKAEAPPAAEVAAPVPSPVVRRPSQREVRIAVPKAAPAVEPTPAQAERAAAAAAAPPRTAKSPALPLWPARVSTGAYGRLVQIGAFGSRLQAKQGWRSMVRAYPAVSRLPAVVVQARNSRGRHYYRFQIGTTSQAHSEVLCQRMDKIGMSCAVVGLPWKPRGVER
ncbi:MAG: SPOR domain-containing protein [Pseudomonadota bacterium]